MKKGTIEDEHTAGYKFMHTKLLLKYLCKQISD